MQPIVKTERYIQIKVYKRENYWYRKWMVSEPTPRNKTEADKGLKPTSNIPEVFATHRGSCLWELRSYINRPGQEHSVHEMGVITCYYFLRSSTETCFSCSRLLNNTFMDQSWATSSDWLSSKALQMDWSGRAQFPWISCYHEPISLDQLLPWTNNEPTNTATWFMHAWFVESAMCVPSGYWSECGRLNCSIQKRPCCVSSNQKSAEPRPTGFLILICVQIQCATSIRQRALQLLGILVEFTMRCPS